MNDSPFLLVALGNPGAKYRDTRHNVGWIAYDQICSAFGFQDQGEKFKGIWKKGSIQGQKWFGVLPQTYMNLSGECVGPGSDFYKIPVENIIVLHDDLDLQTGVIRLKEGGGHAGHNGLKSLDQHLGTNSYKRIRLGIDHPRRLGLQIEVADYVLGRVSSENPIVWQHTFEQAAKALEYLSKDQWRKGMSLLNAAPKDTEKV